ncbi:unnamed protein product [Mytilus edulis]|uniref:DZIP3-like HEPN domain-containing protein n=2 Tax=Mytilus edulis TaxID=6550 RepID=A0A8S3R8J2_MYTED|nr:unnamed protein product [Mytilus edulis]
MTEHHDGTPFGYTNWEAGQPNGGNQPRNLGIDVCATGLLWHDYPTSESKTMDIEDRRRYFIVGSVFLEVVQPLFRTRLENDYTSKGLGSFQDFLNTQQVIHILFHLRHRNAKCCKDISNCVNNSKLPLMYCQWNLLYTENPGQPGHNCHCKFTANPVQLKELDITLAGLILLNCCNLGSTEKNAVLILRRYKNEYLSHNTQGAIIETEYKSLWTDLISFVQQLDPNKQDDLMRIENRPLDEGL